MRVAEERSAEVALVQAAAEGDSLAFETLQMTYRPLIDSMAEQFCAKSDDFRLEDLKQEVLLAFYRAVCTYQVEQKAVTFGLYAKIVIRNRLISLLRKQNRRNQSSGILKPAQSVRDPSERMLDAERRATLLTRYQSVLSAYEMQVFRLYSAGMKPKQIARSLGKTAKSVDNALSRLKAKIKAQENGTKHLL